MKTFMQPVTANGQAKGNPAACVKNQSGERLNAVRGEAKATV